MDVSDLNVQGILNDLHDGLYCVDKNRVITYWNKAAEQISGYSSAEVVGRSCSDNILTHVDIRNTRNQELIMRVKSDIQNPDRTFYTDLNGFQVMYDAKHPTVTKVVVFLISPYGTRLFCYPDSL